MKVIHTQLQGVLLIEPDVFGDERGFLMEVYNRNRFRIHGIEIEFVQDNHSRSVGGVLRGLHYQVRHGQDKLVRVIQGEIFDVAVDIRPGSETFGRWVGYNLSAANRRQLLIPRGFAHGFCVLGEAAEVEYKCSEFYHPEDEGGLIWNDPDVAIDWPIRNPILSEKDQAFPKLSDIALPQLA